jgi:Lon protease-like protein
MDKYYLIECFLVIGICCTCLYLLKSNSKLKNKYNNLQVSCEIKTKMLSNAEVLNNTLAKQISELNSIIETQKEHIQALRRAERRHKYLIKKLNPKNGKKAPLQDSQSN